MTRSAKIDRVTNETSIKLVLDLDGLGKGTIETGIPFFDHMLDQLTFHSLIDLELDAQGDVGIDCHHTVEDCGICLGKAFSKALGDKKGIGRYGFFLLPMDDALIRVALDFSSRSYLSWNVRFPTSSVGNTLSARCAANCTLCSASLPSGITCAYSVAATLPL